MMEYTSLWNTYSVHHRKANTLLLIKALISSCDTSHTTNPKSKFITGLVVGCCPSWTPNQDRLSEALVENRNCLWKEICCTLIHCQVYFCLLVLVFVYRHRQRYRYRSKQKYRSGYKYRYRYTYLFSLISAHLPGRVCSRALYTCLNRRWTSLYKAIVGIPVWLCSVAVIVV